MHVISVNKDITEELLIINISQFSPPDYGSSSWNGMDVDIGISLELAKSLNFGVLGIAEELSEDKRCRMATMKTAFLGQEMPGNNVIMICSYGNNVSLPISIEHLKRNSDLVSISHCKE